MDFYSYRISIYSKKTENSFSYSDFNKENISEYLIVEEKVLKIISDVINFCNIKKIKISDLEIYNKMKKRKVKKFKIEEIIKLVLREKIWCKLKSDELEIHFGYDYYIYILCQSDIFSFLCQNSNELKIQRYKSPYI